MNLKIFLIFCFVNCIKSQRDDEDFLLPNATKPESYTIFITTNVPQASSRFTGVLGVQIKVLEDTKEIYLHSRGHTILDFKLYVLNSPSELSGISFKRVNPDVILFSSEDNLQAGQVYELLLRYQGNLLLTSDGFFRSDYVVNESGSDVYTRQAATQFQPLSARHAFPCYDSLKQNHKATFEISINHDSTYSSISNLPQFYFDKPADGRLNTLFPSTPQLSPSSLAFFISGFEEIIEPMRGTEVEHLVSVRLSETSYKNKLFEVTERILEAVESFMDVQLPAEIRRLHSVALPNFGKEVRSFFGFNIYRENLILFNPAVSPVTKEFYISKLVTNAIVSQFLGNLVTFDTWNDVWIFKGVIKFLEYITDTDEQFIYEVLHPTLQQQLFTAEFPFSVDASLEEEAEEKAACTFRMIYYAIEDGAFSRTLKRLIEENSYKSIKSSKFYETLSEEAGIDLRGVIEGFMAQKTNAVVHIKRIENNLLRVVKKPLALPINVRTSSAVATSAISWLPNTIETAFSVPSLDTAEWYLVNIDQFAFYRVNYEENNWEALIKVLRENLTTFSEKTRAQLIDDSMCLAREGSLSYALALDMLMVLKGETCFLPWSSAMRNLLQLNDLLTSTDIHHDFQKLALNLIESFENAVGFDDLPDEKPIEKLTRNLMIDFVCRFGSSHCLDLMHNKLKTHIDGGEKLPVNLESSVFCFGLMASEQADEGSRLVESLWREMQASGNIEYRLRIISSLGCYRNVKVLYDLLETILASTAEARYLSGETFTIIQTVYSGSTEGVEATIEFMIEYQNDAVRRSQRSDLVDVLVKELPGKIYDEKLFEKFKKMLEALNVADEKQLQAIEQIERNLSLKTSIAAKIESWLRKDSTTSPPTTSLPTTSPSTTVDTTSTTLSGNTFALSSILVMSCVFLRLLL